MSAIFFAAKTLAAVLFLSASFQVSSAEVEVLFGYDGKYITEGRDNLTQGGLVSSELSLNDDAGFFASFWVGQGDATSYRESNDMLGWQTETSAGTVSISHTWLDFNSMPSDREWALHFIVNQTGSI